MYKRIKKEKDFKKLFSKGKKLFSPNLVILLLPAKEISMGMCVGKKHGNSVKRNRIKRLLREAFRSVSSQIHGTYSFILIPKQSKEYTLEKFKKSLVISLKKEGLLSYESRNVEKDKENHF